MIKKQICLIVFSFLVIGLCLAMPGVVAVDPTFTPPEDSPCGWADLSDTVTDATDDVVRYITEAEDGTIGDFHDEIDINHIALIVEKIILSSLVITFADTPNTYSGYEYYFFFDNDTDGNAEYVLYSNVSEGLKPPVSIDFYLQQIADAKYWTGSDWTSTKTAYPGWNTVDTSLSFDSFNAAIYEISTSRVAAVAAYTGNDTYLFADFVPLTPEASGIPGFSFGLVLFGGLTLLGMIILLQREKIRI